MTTQRTINLTAAAAKQMHAESQRLYPYETGGILLGTTADDIVTITHATGPGPYAKHELTRFIRDGDYAQDQLDSNHQASGGQWDYIGEWHSHPAPVGASNRDRESLRWISNNPLYASANPVLLICVFGSDRLWSFLGYQWSDEKAVAVNVTILQGKS